MIIGFTVPGAVRGQGRPRAAIRGKHATVYETADDRSYKGLIQFHALKRAEELGVELPLEPGTLGFCVSIIVVKAIPKSYPAKRREKALAGYIAPQTKPDLDNVAKIYLDALNGVAWKDDSSVTKLYVTKVFGSSDKVRVLIAPEEAEKKGGKES